MRLKEKLKYYFIHSVLVRLDYRLSGVLLFLLLFPGRASSEPSDPQEGDAAETNRNRPNVILVMTDDQGYGELSYHGNPILETPNLDGLAKESLRLTDFHVAPMCTPTRGELMTGMDAARNGAVNVSSGRTMLKPELNTMADYFTVSDYSTALFGKWHLGDNYPYRPGDRGFDEAIWFPSSHISSVPDYWGNNYFDDTYIHNGERERYQGYSTDVFFDEAMSWMRRQKKSESPFFLYLPTNTAHYPFWAPKEDLQAIRQALEETNQFDNLSNRLRENLIRYLAMIRNIDTNMGRLMDFLDKENLARNTILIFTNDNGTTFGHRYYNAGMRGRKAQLWEGGHRVSFFLRWPGGDLGMPRDIEGLTSVKDVLPTLIDLCDLVTSEPTDFDGINLAPVLRHKTRVPEERKVVINYSRMPIGFDYPSPTSQTRMIREGSAVLWKHWRLLRGDELYNLKKDPRQQENVIGQYPQVARKMKTHLQSWWTGVKDSVNDYQTIPIGSPSANPVKLTAVDWLDVFVDQQKQVRQGARKNGYWNLQVDRAGTYKFTLRRWPREINRSIGEGLPSTHAVSRAAGDTVRPGVALPVSRARIFINGLTEDHKRGAFQYNNQKQIRSGQEAVTFRVDLNKGPVRLHTWFDDDSGHPVTGAYYVYVKRTSGKP